jgi:hypothetical protein
MLTYQNGNRIEIGDSVRFERGRTSGTVYELVDTSAKASELGVEEEGVMLKSAPFGLVFLSVTSLLADPLEFISHGAAGAEL